MLPQKLVITVVRDGHHTEQAFSRPRLVSDTLGEIEKSKVNSTHRAAQSSLNVAQGIGVDSPYKTESVW